METKIFTDPATGLVRRIREVAIRRNGILSFFKGVFCGLVFCIPLFSLQKQFVSVKKIGTVFIISYHPVYMNIELLMHSGYLLKLLTIGVMFNKKKNPVNFVLNCDEGTAFLRCKSPILDVMLYFD